MRKQGHEDWGHDVGQQETKPFPHKLAMRKYGPYSRGSGVTCNFRHVSWYILSMGYVDQWKRKYHPLLEGDLLLLLALMSLAKHLR